MTSGVYVGETSGNVSTLVSTNSSSATPTNVDMIIDEDISLSPDASYFIEMTTVSGTIQFYGAQLELALQRPDAFGGSY